MHEKTIKMGLIKIKDKEFDLKLEDEALIMAILELTKEIKILRISINNG